MAFELTVKMGGLCLLLERNDYAGRGLFALMPNSAHHPHMAVFEYNPANNAGNGSGVAPINGHDLDLTGHLAGGNMVGLPVEVAPLSRYAGGAPVDPKWTGSSGRRGTASFRQLLCTARWTPEWTAAKNRTTASRSIRFQFRNFLDRPSPMHGWRWVPDIQSVLKSSTRQAIR